MQLSKLSSSYIIYLCAYSLIPLIKIIVIPLYARYLMPSEYGIVGLVLAISTFLGPIFTLGLDAASSREYFEQDQTNLISYKSFLLVVFLFLLLFGAFFFGSLSIIGLSLNSYIVKNYGLRFLPHIIMALFIAFLNSYNAVGNYVLQAKQDAFAMSSVHVGRVALSAVVAITAIFFLHQGALALLWGEVISIFIANLVIWCRLLRGVHYKALYHSLSLIHSIRYIKKLLKYGLPIVPQNFFNMVISFSDRLILAQYVSLSDIGIYSFGVTLGFSLSLLLTAINNAYLPFFMSKAGDNNFPEQHRAASQMIIIFIGFTCMSFGVFAPEIVHIMGGIRYIEASTVFQFVCVGYIWSGLFALASLPIYYNKKTVILAKVAGISAGLNIFANFIIIPAFGIQGAGLSKVAAYCLMALLTGMVVKRFYSIHYSMFRLCGTALAFSFIVVITYGMTFIPRLTVVFTLMCLCSVWLFKLLKQYNKCVVSPLIVIP